MQKSFIGAGSLNNLRIIVDKYNANKVLIVTGRKSFTSSGAQEKVKKILSNTDVVIFNDFKNNPKIEDVTKGVLFAQSEIPDLIVSIGGGSVIDMAKMIRALSSQSNNNTFELINGPESIKNKGVPLAAVPTTYGSGSEATKFAVVYIDGVKFSLSHDYIVPDYVILDPCLNYSLPKKTAASCSMDALSQAVESYWSIKSTLESKIYAKKAISLILPALEKAVHGNHSAIFIMLKAANLSGKSINITTTTAPHALSYPLTAFFGVQHGHAVALLLGKFFIINSQTNNYEIIDPRGKSYLTKTMNELFDLFNVKCAAECENKWYNLMKKIGLSTSLHDSGISSATDKKTIFDNVNNQRLINNPVKVTRDILSMVLSDH